VIDASCRRGWDEQTVDFGICFVPRTACRL